MEGYSIKEAATVLGVPKRRVWELLARGVLAGAPAKGGGMRVHLRDASSTPARVTDGHGGSSSPDPKRVVDGTGHAANGGSNGHHDPSAPPSVFHDLLTEFRNLTERYGQALLALGEARGEVASLRSRVELLEARLDLRLPGPRRWNAEAGATAEAAAEETQAPPVPGPGPEVADRPVDLPSLEPAQPGASTPVDSAPPETDEVASDEGETPRRPRKRRRGGSKAAVSGFAEALARAEDPTAADLPEPIERRRPDTDQLAALDSVAPSAAVPTHELGAPPPFLEATLATAAEASAAAASAAPPPVEEPAPTLEPEGPLPEVQDVGLPEVGAPAMEEAEPVAVEAEPEYSAEWDEPDWIAEEDLDQEWQRAESESVATVSEPVEEEVPAVEAPAVEEPQAAVEPMTVEAPTIDEPAVVQEPVAEESELVTEASGVEEPLVAEEPAVAEAAAIEAAEPTTAEEPQIVIEEPQAVAEASAVEEPLVAEEPRIAEEAVVAEGEATADESMALGETVIDEAATVEEAPIEEPQAVAEPTEAEEPRTVAEAPLIDEAATAQETAIDEPLVAEGAVAAEEAEAVAEPMEQQAPPIYESTPMTPEEAPHDFLFLAPDDASEAASPAQANAAPPMEDEAPPSSPDVAASEAYEEELMWLGDEFRPSSSAWQSLGEEPAARPGSPGMTSPGSPHGDSDDATLEQLARQRGWDDAELSAIRSLLGDQQGPSTVDQADVALAAAGEEPEPSVARGSIETETEPVPEPELTSEPVPDLGPVLPLPGAAELDQAMSELQATGTTSAPLSGELAAVPVVPDQEAPERPAEVQGSENDEVAPAEASPQAEQGEQAEPHSHAESPAQPLPPPGPLPRRDLPARGNQDWLRGRRGPAANAYRRLRRLFPG